MNGLDFPFNGLQTEFTAVSLVTMLGLILVYALLTSWVYVLLARLVRPLIDRVGQVVYRLPGLFGFVIFAAATLLWVALPGGPVVVLVTGLILGIASFFGFAHSLVFTPLVFVVIAASFALGWYPFGAWSGIGWLGFVPYVILSFKAIRLYV